MTVKSKLLGKKIAKLEEIGKPSRTLLDEAESRIGLGRSSCCGLKHYNGLSWVTSPLHARALQMAAGVAILVTVTYEEKGAIPHLKAAGFLPVAKWKNPNTNRNITMMMGPGVRVMNGVEIFTKIEGVNLDGSSKKGEDEAGEQEASREKPKTRAVSRARSTGRTAARRCDKS